MGKVFKNRFTIKLSYPFFFSTHKDWPMKTLRLLFATLLLSALTATALAAEPSGNKIRPPVAGNLGYIISIGSLYIPGSASNYAVDLQLMSHSNPFAATFQVINVSSTNASPTAWYDGSTNLIFVPGIQTNFTGANGGLSCVIYDVYYAYQSGYWVPWQANAKGSC